MAQQQPTAEQLRAMQKAKNEQFIALSYSQTIKANSLTNNTWALNKTINHESPIVTSAYAHKITFRFKFDVTSAKGTGTIAPTASYPYSLGATNIEVKFGQKVATFHPFISKVLNLLEGHGRKEQFDVVAGGIRSNDIDAMIKQVPTDFSVDGVHTVAFDVTYDLNQLHPASVNGLLPVFTNTRLQTAISCPQSIGAVNADPLENAFELTGNASVTAQGSCDVIVHYRDNISMTTRQNLELDLSGLPTVQLIELPNLNNLAPNSWNNVAFRNPYPYATLIHIVCDANQSDVFAKESNLTGYQLSKAENSASAFFRYDESNPIANYFQSVRETWGQDMPSGILVFDPTSMNQSNPSQKLGVSYLNVTGDGYPSGNFGVKLNSIGSNRVSKILSYAVILNGEGIQAQ